MTQEAKEPMPARIRCHEGVVLDVAVAAVALRVVRVLYHSIRTQEPTDI